MAEGVESSGMLVSIIVLSFVLCIVVFFLAYKLIYASISRHEYQLIGDDVFRYGDAPREFLNDEETLRQLAEEFDFTSLSPEEQGAYIRGEEYSKNNPPNFNNTRGKSMTHQDDLVVKEKGLNAFEFEQDEGIVDARYIVADKTEIHFLHNDTPYSTATSVLNYCLPVKNRTYSDTIYFETKVFEFDASQPNGHFAIGLVTKPYPLAFRLPGYNNFSIAYESTGNLKINKPFPTPLQQHLGPNSKFNAQVLPPLRQSDTVGFGYVVPSGTIFITRNGKKVMDVMKGCYVDLYPAVGCFSTNAKFQVNLGQMGYVWIEANVRKYGFISTSDYRKMRGEQGLAALPQYGSYGTLEGDKLLAKGEELPPGYPVEELDFFGRAPKDLMGSSSRALMSPDAESNEKESNDKEDDAYHSSSMVTDEPEEIMDLRERLYEHTVTQSISDESTPLLPALTSHKLSEDRETSPSTGNEPLVSPEPSRKGDSAKKKKKKKGKKKNKRK